MNSLAAFRRLRAWAEGRPLPLGSTRRVHVAAPEDALVVAFLRMGGESRPWGIAWGHPGRPPRVETVPEARDPARVAGLVGQFAPDLLGHLRAEPRLPLRQVWLPNPSHLEMLHNLAYTYTYARNSAPQLMPLGRACGWLFRDSQRPGAQCVQVATEALRAAWTFPAEDVRQGHLGFLLAWLAPGTREERAARAAEAERLPVATSLDPNLERERLQPLVEQKAEREVHAVLAPELTRRFELTCRAMQALLADPRRENRGLQALLQRSADEQRWEYHHLEQREDPWLIHPETDRNPAVAASRYLNHAACAEEAAAALLPDDAELLAEALAAGDGFRGIIVEVRDEGPGRTTRPVWLVEAPKGPLRLREQNQVAHTENPKRIARLRRIQENAATRLFELEITGLKTARAAEGPAPNSPAWRGREVTFLKEPAVKLGFQRAQTVWDQDGPGAWLTHRNPAAAGGRP